MTMTTYFMTSVGAGPVLGDTSATNAEANLRQLIQDSNLYIKGNSWAWYYAIDILKDRLSCRDS